MGRILQIRVMAYTYSEEEVQKRWPGLHRVAFGDGEELPAGSGRGMLDLIRVLEDKRKFADLEDKIKEALNTPMQELNQEVLKLESYLADRKPQEADKVSYVLEDMLDHLEGKISPLL